VRAVGGIQQLLCDHRASAGESTKRSTYGRSFRGFPARVNCIDQGTTRGSFGSGGPASSQLTLIPEILARYSAVFRDREPLMVEARIVAPPAPSSNWTLWPRRPAGAAVTGRLVTNPPTTLLSSKRAE
jgi:hypothetical protein